MKLSQKMIPFMKACVPVIFLLIMVLWNPLYTFDALLCDGLYSHLDGTSQNIKIISVDEETLDAYGNFGVWSREKTAELIEMLYADEENAPAIVALDFLFLTTLFLLFSRNSYFHLLECLIFLSFVVN